MNTLHPLGRHPWQDPASRAFGAPQGQGDLRSVTWRRYGPSLQQANTKACTGHMIAHAANTRPVHVTGHRLLTHDDAMRLYSAATRIDPFDWTYPPTDDGSSVLAACKAAKAAGLITEYRWCFGLDHVLRSLMLGPVALGTVWLEDMFDPDRTGLVTATGPEAGGHAYLAVGVNTTRKTVVCQNSWGPGWGANGRFQITWGDLDRLLRDQGDAVQITMNPTMPAAA